MISVQALQAFLSEVSDVDPDASVGIDEDGHTLIVVADNYETGEYIEIGGVPEEITKPQHYPKKLRMP